MAVGSNPTWAHGRAAIALAVLAVCAIVLWQRLLPTEPVDPSAPPSQSGELPGRTIASLQSPGKSSVSGVRNAIERPERSIGGIVVAEDTGLPICALIGNNDTSTWSDERTGAFSLSTRELEIEVSASGYWPKALTVPADEANSDIRIELRSKTVISLRVTTEDGRPLEGASLCVLREDARYRACRLVSVSETDPDGRFALAGPPGVVVIARHRDTMSIPVRCYGAETIVCGTGTSSILRMVDSAGSPIACDVLLTSLSGLVGVRMLEPTGANGALVMPVGQWVIMLPGFPPVVGLQAAHSYAGQILEVAVDGDVILQVGRTSVRSVLVRDAHDGHPLQAELQAEALFPGGWRSIGPAVRCDPEGRADSDRISVGIAAVASDYKRIRVAARGYLSSFLPSLAEGSAIALSKAAMTVKVMATRDGVPYYGHLVLRELSDSGVPGQLLHIGSIGRDGVDVAVSASGRLAAMSGARSDASVLASGSPSLDIRQGVLQLILPPSSRIQIGGCPHDYPNIAAKSGDGDLISGVRSQGQLEFRNLFPGEYQVGPAEVLRVGADGAAVVSLEVGSGTVHGLLWNSLWQPAEGVRGVVRLANGGPIPDGRLRVLPWAGNLPRTGPAALALAGSVASDGSFETRAGSQAVDRLGVYSFMAGGVPVLLGEYSPAQQDLLVEARHITISLQGDRPQPAHILVVAPVKGDGRSAGQWQIPCSTNQTVDLGLLPDDITTVHLITGNGVQAITLPGLGGVVAVPIAK